MFQRKGVIFLTFWLQFAGAACKIQATRLHYHFDRHKLADSCTVLASYQKEEGEGTAEHRWVWGRRSSKTRGEPRRWEKSTLRAFRMNSIPNAWNLRVLRLGERFEPWQHFPNYMMKIANSFFTSQFPYLQAVKVLYGNWKCQRQISNHLMAFWMGPPFGIYWFCTICLVFFSPLRLYFEFTAKQGIKTMARLSDLFAFWWGMFTFVERRPNVGETWKILKSIEQRENEVGLWLWAIDALKALDGCRL